MNNQKKPAIGGQIVTVHLIEKLSRAQLMCTSFIDRSGKNLRHNGMLLKRMTGRFLAQKSPRYAGINCIKKGKS
jgi:hypothetical protein